MVVPRQRRSVAPCSSAGVELDDDLVGMKGALRRLELDRMAAEVETFVSAPARDLIEPADFAA
jgi:hypothetical protein